MKLSESAEKMTILPEKVWRIYDEDGKAMADLITMADEVVRDQHGITLFDPIETWKECTYVNCTARCLSTPIYGTASVSTTPRAWMISRSSARPRWARCGTKSSVLREPHRYYVDLSQKLWDTRSALLKKLSK